MTQAEPSSPAHYGELPICLPKFSGSIARQRSVQASAHCDIPLAWGTEGCCGSVSLSGRVFGAFVLVPRDDAVLGVMQMLAPPEL